jgi:hypothetical protein
VDLPADGRTISFVSSRGHSMRISLLVLAALVLFALVS